nr:MAG TPA: hypothetical protein [Caudoviricetes sp.]
MGIPRTQSFTATQFRCFAPYRLSGPLIDGVEKPGEKFYLCKKDIFQLLGVPLTPQDQNNLVQRARRRKPPIPTHYWYSSHHRMSLEESLAFLERIKGYPKFQNLDFGWQKELIINACCDLKDTYPLNALLIYLGLSSSSGIPGSKRDFSSQYAKMPCIPKSLTQRIYPWIRSTYLVDKAVADEISLRKDKGEELHMIIASLETPLMLNLSSRKGDINA